MASERMFLLRLGGWYPDVSDEVSWGISCRDMMVYCYIHLKVSNVGDKYGS